MVSFCSPTFILKHVPLLSKKNDQKSSCMDVHFNKGNLKSSCTLTLPTTLPLKDLASYKNEEVMKSKRV